MSEGLQEDRQDGAVHGLRSLLALLVFASTAQGGISALNSSIAISRDGTRVLVVLSPDIRGDQTPTASLPDGRIVNLQDVFWKSGVYQSSTLEPAWQVDWFSQQLDLLYSDDLDWEMARLVEQARQKLGPLAAGRCYCLKVPAVLGGSYAADNVGTISRSELISFSGDLAEQIRDVPDGSHIKIKFVP